MIKNIYAKDHKTRKLLEKAAISDEKVVITGSISDFKKLGIRQGDDVMGAIIKPDPEVIEAKDFLEREKINDHIRDSLGDNLTLNRLNGHKIIGSKDDLDRLFLSKYSNILGVRIEEV